jgi:hypothetical protein
LDGDAQGRLKHDDFAFIATTPGDPQVGCGKIRVVKTRQKLGRNKVHTPFWEDRAGHTIPPWRRRRAGAERIKRMNDLRPLYMKLLSARVGVQAVLGQIDRSVTAGTAEGRRSALALQPKLEKVLANEQQALTAYMAAVRGPDPSMITRSAFNDLTPEKKMVFIRARGKVID